jgi:hypothetical protein
MSYGPNFSDLLRGAADHVDKILRGQNRATSRSINPLSLTCHQSDHRPCFRKIGAMGWLSRHTVAHVGHRQHFGSGLFGGQGLRRCSALLGEASKLFRLSARHGHRPHLVSYRSNPMRASGFRNQSGFSWGRREGRPAG